MNPDVLRSVAVSTAICSALIIIYEIMIVFVPILLALVALL